MSFIDELWEDRESWQSWIYTKLMNIIARKKASLVVAAGILVFIYVLWTLKESRKHEELCYECTADSQTLNQISKSERWHLQLVLYPSPIAQRKTSLLPCKSERNG